MANATCPIATAGDLMTPTPRTCSPFSSVLEAVLIFRDAECGAVPVVNAGQPVGILTDRDVVLALAQHSNVVDLPVDDVMTKGAITIGPDASLEEVRRNSPNTASAASWLSAPPASSTASSPRRISPATCPRRPRPPCEASSTRTDRRVCAELGVEAHRKAAACAGRPRPARSGLRPGYLPAPLIFRPVSLTACPTSWAAFLSFSAAFSVAASPRKRRRRCRP